MNIPHKFSLWNEGYKAYNFSGIAYRYFNIYMLKICIDRIDGRIQLYYRVYHDCKCSTKSLASVGRKKNPGP